MNKITKHPEEALPVYINFFNELVVDETVSSVGILCVSIDSGADGLSEIVQSSTLTTPELKLVLQAGVNGGQYKITVRATTSLSNVFEFDLLLTVSNHPIDRFYKQPVDTFLIKFDFEKQIEPGDSINTHEVIITDKRGVDVTDDNSYGSEIDGDYAVLVGVQSGITNDIFVVAGKVVTVNGYTYMLRVLMEIVDK